MRLGDYKTILLFLFSTLSAFALCVSAIARQGSDASAKSQVENPVGTWRGESKCVVKPSSCRKEDSVYRISSNGKRQDRVNLSANKIVDGKEVNMGNGECAYDAKAYSIDCPLPNGNSIRLQLNGATLEGRMTLRDGTLWRKISLRRAE